MEKKIIYIAEQGVLPDTGEDCAPALQEIFDRAEDGCTVHFKTGVYYLRRPITVKGRRHLSIYGNLSTLVAHFDPCGPFSENNDLFCFSDCEDLTVCGFFMDTDAPIGATGYVTAIDRENETVDVQIDPEFPVTGYEHFCGTNSFDKDGSPDYAMATYHFAPTEGKFINSEGKEDTRLVGLDYTVIGDHLVRLNLKGTVPAPGSPVNDEARLAVGHAINIRYQVYGNSIFRFSACHRVLCKDIIIHSAASFGATVRPRSSDFTFDNFSMRVPQGSKRLKVANADGIHLLGLTGSLTFRNCNIEGLGDDTLNIHGIAGGILTLDEKEHRIAMHCPYRGTSRPLPEHWADAGDVIVVYDSATFLKKGSFKIAEIDENNCAVYTDETGEFAVGDTLANSAYFASLHVDGCTLRNTRARGLLIQTQDVLIENCYISGMSLPAILCAPDIRVWWEVGPTRNVEIRNCIIEKCAHIRTPANQGAVVFKACHDDGITDYPAGVHENIYLHGNLFRDNPNSAIFISAARNIRVENNRFENCCFDPHSPELPYSAYDAVLLNCENVHLSGNTSSRGEETLVCFINCENAEI